MIRHALIVCLLTLTARADWATDARADGVTTAAEAAAWLAEPVPVATNVVEVARPAEVLQYEQALNALATSYLPQRQLDQIPKGQKMAALTQAVNSARENANGNARADRVADGVKLLLYDLATQQAGGGFRSPDYLRASVTVTNVVTAPRWTLYRPAVPSRSEIRAALEP